MRRNRKFIQESEFNFVAEVFCVLTMGLMAFIGVWFLW